MKTILAAVALSAATISFLPFALRAQESASFVANPDATATASVPSSRSIPSPPHALSARWLDLTTFSHAERYRNAFAVGGGHNFNSAQARSLIAGSLKLDPAARFRIGFRASSGRYFNWAFSSYTGPTFVARVTSPNNLGSYFTPVQIAETANAIFADPVGFAFTSDGLQSNGWQFYMRELFLSATPIDPLTVEFGSFGIERGYSTEITTFDEDGYLSGERIRLRAPKHFFVDEIGFTNAFFGDIATPSFFKRGSSLKESNYRQLFANKKFNSHLALSAEYTRQIGIDTLRQAALLAPAPNNFVDTIRLEAYQRLNSHTFPGTPQSPIGPISSISVPSASGFAITLDKKIGRLSGNIGFATIDSDYSVYGGSRFMHSVGFPLNGDTYGQGNRPFAHASFRLTPGISAFGFYTHEVGSTRVLTLNQQGYNAGLAIDLKAFANRKQRVF